MSVCVCVCVCVCVSFPVVCSAISIFCNFLVLLRKDGKTRAGSLCMTEPAFCSI